MLQCENGVFFFSHQKIDIIYSLFRHVVLPKEIAKLVPKTRLMSEEEWRSIGVQMSTGWIHYMIHKPGNYCLWNLP